MAITIGIDGNEANEREKVGVHQLAYNLLWSIKKINDRAENPDNFVIYLKRDPNKSLPTENSFWKYKIISGGRLWIIRCLMPTLWREKKIDVFFAPSHYLPPLLKIPAVCAITDLGYLKFSGLFRKYDFWQLKYWTAISIFISKYIIAISESTKNDIVRHYPFASKKVKTVYLGYDKGRFNTKISPNLVRRTKKRYKIDSDYLLFIGTLRPNKNIEGLLEAFSLIRRKNYKIKLVIAGKRGWFYDSIFRKTKELGLERNVIYTDYVDESEKPYLIKGARTFVLPSFWEGFGLDVISALACGVPVVISSTGSLPEVGGNAAIYVDPYKSESIASGIEKVLNLGTKEYNDLVHAGFAQVAKFSWEESAKKTLEIIKNAV